MISPLTVEGTDSWNLPSICVTAALLTSVPPRYARAV